MIALVFFVTLLILLWPQAYGGGMTEYRTLDQWRMK